MMRLILIGGRYDPVLGAVAHHFQQVRPEVAIRHYRLEDLAAAPWMHRVGEAGVENSACPGDTQDPSSSECLIFNRLRFEPGLLYTTMKPADRDYARSELLALLMSWSAGLPGKVVNRSTACGLAGPLLRPWQWLAAAYAVGLRPFPAFAGSSRRRVGLAPAGQNWVERPDLLPIIADPRMTQVGANHPYAHAPACEEAVRIDVVADEIVAPAGTSIRDDQLAACRVLARSVSADILAVTLGRPAGREDWHFLSADPIPSDMPEQSMRTLCTWLAGQL